jgi:hypothetical protein
MNESESTNLNRLVVLDHDSAEAIFGMLRYLTYDSEEHKHYSSCTQQERADHVWRHVAAAARWLEASTQGQLRASVARLLTYAKKWTEVRAALSHQPPPGSLDLFDA